MGWRSGWQSGGPSPACCAGWTIRRSRSPCRCSSRRKRRNGSGTRAYSGEGLVGLSWAFLRAGAHNVIGALWEVSDASTPQLMDALYRELSQGKDPATALRDAKLKLLHSADSDSVFKKPFYWAPFQLYAGS